MDNTIKDMKIPEEIAPEVLELASRYYAKQMQSYSPSELVLAGKEVDIPAELIQQAIRDIQAQHHQKLERQKQIQKQRQLFLKISVGILIGASIWSLWTYNSFTNSSSQVEAAWAQVENQLQRRIDLIPNLVSVTQTYAKHEQQIVSLLVESRRAYLQAKTPTQKAAASLQVNQAIEHFRNYAAIHPQLQSSQLFINLQYELTGTENRIAVERMRYNRSVQAYNQNIQRFPNSLFAKTFGFEKKPYFQAAISSSEN